MHILKKTKPPQSVGGKNCLRGFPRLRKGIYHMKNIIKKVILSSVITALVFSLSIISVFAASSVSGLPLSTTLEVGEVIVWNPNPSGGNWTFDSSFLDVKFNGSMATVTAKKEGDTKMEYSPGVGNDPAVINITIKANASNSSEQSAATNSQTSSSTVSRVAAAASATTASDQNSSSTASSSQTSSQTSSSEQSSNESSRVENPAAGYSNTFGIIIAVAMTIAVILSIWNKKFIMS